MPREKARRALQECPVPCAHAPCATLQAPPPCACPPTPAPHPSPLRPFCGSGVGHEYGTTWSISKSRWSMSSDELLGATSCACDTHRGTSHGRVASGKRACTRI